MQIILIDDILHALNRLTLAVKEVCPNDSVQAFTSPSEALEFCRTNIPDVVFSDIEMSGKNGIELALEIKQINPLVRIVFCTGYSEYALQAIKMHASGYIMKPVRAEDVRKEIEAMTMPQFIPHTQRIRLQTFGNFEVFADDRIVDFPRAKCKEILAVLTDNNGATVRTEQIADLLWEDGIFSDSRRKQLHTIISDLKKVLESIHASDIIKKTEGGYAIDKTKVDCDYFRLLQGDVSALNGYKGLYMYGYDWACLPDIFNRMNDN